MNTSASFVERVRPLIAGRPRGEQLFLAALLESAAAARYREWAGAVESEDLAAGLQLCAEREDAIAETVRDQFAAELSQPEDLKAVLAAIQGEVEALFGGRSLDEQMDIQAAAERGGEQLWTELAAAETDAVTKSVLLECAALESASAGFLESRNEDRR